MAAAADRNFILQQGVELPEGASCRLVSSALLFQARVVGPVVLVGTILQSPVVFGVLAAALWWSSLLPRWNPFDAAYNRTLGRRPGAPALRPSPTPRRFAQGMAATFATGIAASLAAHLSIVAWVLEGFFLVAVAALMFGRLCLGSFVYHLVSGRAAFAMDTLPWRRGA